MSAKGKVANPLRRKIMEWVRGNPRATRQQIVDALGDEMTISERSNLYSTIDDMLYGKKQLVTVSQKPARFIVSEEWA